MQSQLERAINLAADTGDKIIVVDEMNDRSSVVMNLDDYEKLLNGQNKGRNGVKNLTEEELLDKINRDIVTWKDANSDKKFFEEMADDDDNLDEEVDFKDEPAFAKAMADKEDDADIPDYAAPDFAAEGDLIPEENPKEIKVEPIPEKPAVDEDENVYYYHEPESSSAKASESKEESGFTSIKDELKNRKHWEIPEEVKKSAEDVRL